MRRLLPAIGVMLLLFLCFFVAQLQAQSLQVVRSPGQAVITGQSVQTTHFNGSHLQCMMDTQPPSIDCNQAQPAQNILGNNSFENGAVFNQPFSTGWNPFGAVFAIDGNIIPAAQDGRWYLKIFGGNSGVFQDHPVNAGDVLDASVYIQNASFDPMLPGCEGFVKLEYFNSANQQISFTESNRINNTLPQNQWTQITLNDVAPAGAVTVRMVVIMQCSAGGAVMFDNASLINASGSGQAGDITVDNDPGQCGAQVAVAVPLHSDNCGVASITNSFNGTGNASGFYPVGVTTVTWTATDTAGNSSSCSVDITVNDTEAPVISCNIGGGNILNNNSFETGAVFNQPFGTAWTPFGAVFAIDGSIIPAAQDGNWYLKMFGGNSGIFQDHPVAGGDPLTATVYIENASFDPMLPGCEGFIKLEYFNSANQLISVVESNKINNSLPQNQWTQITLNDVAPAAAVTVRMVVIMQCSAGGAVMFDNASLINNNASGGNITVDNATGQCGAVVNYANLPTDNCPGFTVAQTAGLPNGASFPVGTTTNTFVVTDAAGNQGSCSFDVTVIDVEDPTIDCQASQGAPNILNNNSFENGAVFNQLFGTDWTRFGAVFAIDGSIIPSAQDGNWYLKMFGGNSGLFQDQPVAAGDPLTASVYIQNASFDPMLPGCEGFIKLEYFDSNNGLISFTESNRINNTLPQNQWTQITLNDVAPAGAVTVRMVVIMQCSAGGAVMFDNASLINTSQGGGLIGNVTVGNDAGQCGAQLQLAVPFHADNCLNTTITNSFNGTGDASGFYPVGVTTVTWTVTDGGGNSASCSVDITVNDTENPTISCNPGSMNLLGNNSFETGAVFNQPFNTGWQTFGPVFAIDGSIIPAAQDGNWYLKLFGGNTGLFQDHPVNAGDALTASVYIQNASFDPMLPGCEGFVKLEYFDSNNGLISFTESNKLNNTLPQNTWTQVTLNDVAPAGAVTVRMVVIMQCSAGGAVMFDNASLVNNSGGGNVTVDNDQGLCSAVVTYANQASDNCPGFTVAQTAGLPSGSAFPVGTTTNTFVVTDAAGNTATCSFDVTVNDTEAPSIACNIGGGGNVLNNTSFENGAVFNQPFNTGWQTFGPVFAIDGSIIPAAQDGNWYLKLFGANTGLFQDHPVTPGDPLTASVYIQNASFDPMLPGCEGFVKLEYFDSNNGLISVSESNKLNNTLPQNTWTQVTLNDVAPPGAATVRFVVIMQCTAGGAVMFDNAALINANGSGGNITLNNDAGVCGAVANYGNTPMDNCPNFTVAQTSGIPNGGTFPVGTTTNTFVVTDAAGNQGSCSFDVTVIDNEAPTIDCQAAQGAPNILNNNSFENGAVFNQLFGTDWTRFGAVFAIDGSIIPSAQDGNWYLKMFGGNSGLFQDQPVAAGDPLTASVYIQNASFDPMLPGCEGFIKLEYFDSNNGLISFTESNRINNTLPQNTWTQVTLNDVAPTGAVTVRMVVIMQCSAGGAVMFDNASLIGNTQGGGLVGDVTVGNDAGQCGAQLQLAVPLHMDNCPTTTITNSFNGTSNASGFYPVGTTVVTWTVTDAAGNSADCSVNITVTDTSAPVVSCPADVTVECTASTDPANTGSATATDNCDANPAVSASDVVMAGNCAQESTIIRTWTSTDAAGNSSSCVQVINVIDTVAPTFVNLVAVDSLTCGSGVLPAISSYSATDNCDPAPVITVTADTFRVCYVSAGSSSDDGSSDDSGSSSSGSGSGSGSGSSSGSGSGSSSSSGSSSNSCSFDCLTITLPSNGSSSSSSSDDGGSSGSSSSDDDVARATCAVVRTLTATDACGNTTTATQTLFLFPAAGSSSGSGSSDDGGCCSCLFSGNNTKMAAEGGGAGEGATLDMQLDALTLSAYPNPTSGSLRVILNSSDYRDEGSYTIRIMDVVGHEVVRKEIGLSNGYGSTELDLGNNSNGVYFIVLDDGKQRIVERIVKQ